jgi:putative acetyltransferase
MFVRPEHAPDIAAVRAVNLAAFPTPAEADLVDALRTQAQPLVSLVSEADGEIVGHILFSPVTLDGQPALRIMGLAPMAVRPSHQRRGVGAALVRAGLDCCRELGAQAVVVLGHPGYYPRFGFTPASRAGIRCEFDAPEEAFMRVELVPGSLKSVTGTIRFHQAFRDL